MTRCIASPKGRLWNRQRSCPWAWCNNLPALCRFPGHPGPIIRARHMRRFDSSKKRMAGTRELVKDWSVINIRQYLAYPRSSDGRSMPGQFAGSGGTCPTSTGVWSLHRKGPEGKPIRSIWHGSGQFSRNGSQSILLSRQRRSQRGPGFPHIGVPPKSARDVPCNQSSARVDRRCSTRPGQQSANSRVRPDPSVLRRRTGRSVNARARPRPEVTPLARPLREFRITSLSDRGSGMNAVFYIRAVPGIKRARQRAFGWCG